MNQPATAFVHLLPTTWIENFVRTFEDGRVQKHPHARFVNATGECCLVGALAGIRRSDEFGRTEVGRRFSGSPVEALSRAFEARRITAQEFYEEALLTLVSRSVAAPARELVGA